VMGGAVWLVSRQLEPLAMPHLLGALVKVFVPITVGALVYFASARALKLPEATALLRRIR